jgi:hypothetical protein
MEISVVDKIYIKELNWTEWVLIHPTLGVVHIHDAYDEPQRTPILYGITDNGIRLADNSVEFSDCLTAVEKYEIQNRPANFFDEDYVAPTPDELDTGELVKGLKHIKYQDIEKEKQT